MVDFTRWRALLSVGPSDRPAKVEADTIKVATTETIELTSVSTRREHDLIGERDIPAEAYWGVHTLRAVENFPITGVTVGHFPDFVRRPRLRKAGSGTSQLSAWSLIEGKGAGHRTGVSTHSKGG